MSTCKPQLVVDTHDRAGSPEATLATMSALVIDDEELMRDFLCMAVEKSGVGRVVPAGSGPDALYQIELSQHTIDLVICDLQIDRKSVV